MIYIVQSLWNEEITSKLATAAKKEIEAANLKAEVVKVPGALEIPLAVKWLWAGAQREQKELYGFVACGCIVQGGTYHFTSVSNESGRALMDLSLEIRLPIGHGVLSVYHLEQAWERSGSEENKGREAAQAVLDMIALKKERNL